MKLGELKAQIRQMKNAPTIPMVVDGKVVWVKVQKVSLMEELDSIFSSKVDETNLTLNGDRVSPIILKHALAMDQAVNVVPSNVTDGEMVTVSIFTITPGEGDDLLDDDLLADDDGDDLLA